MEVISSQAFDISAYQENLDTTKKWDGKIDGYSLVAHQNTDKESVFAVVNDKEKIISILIFEELKEDYLQIKNAWSCNREGKGLRPKLINRIIKKCPGLKILTDVEMTRSSVLAYEKNRNSGGLSFKVYDMNTGCVLEYRSDLGLYSDPMNLLTKDNVPNVGYSMQERSRYVWIFGS